MIETKKHYTSSDSEPLITDIYAGAKKSSYDKELTRATHFNVQREHTTSMPAIMLNYEQIINKDLLDSTPIN